MLQQLTNKFSDSLPWLADNTLFLARSGSIAYGTNTPTSDEDYKGVCFSPREYYLGFLKKFEQAQGKDPDLTIYEIRKFFNLAADCNPSIIEVMWVDPSDIIHCSKLWEKHILPNRDKFLSTKAKHTFSGYATSQLKRIKTHRHWLMNPIELQPTRTQFGLPEYSLISPDQLRAAESVIKRKLDEWNIDIENLDPAQRIEWQGKLTEMLAALQYTEKDLWKSGGNLLNFDKNFMEVLDRERSYRGAMTAWHQYLTWKKERNPIRAELEAKYSYDCKHASHLVRLLRMCREILETGKVIVKRPDAQELLEIRNGAWDYDKLVTWAEQEDVLLNEVAKNSKLSKQPDRVFLDNLCHNVVSWGLRLSSKNFNRAERRRNSKISKGHK
jgi:predicted nucleotidyltransferase